MCNVRIHLSVLDWMSRAEMAASVFPGHFADAQRSRITARRENPNLQSRSLVVSGPFSDNPKPTMLGCHRRIRHRLCSLHRSHAAPYRKRCCAKISIQLELLRNGGPKALSVSTHHCFRYPEAHEVNCKGQGRPTWVETKKCRRAGRQARIPAALAPCAPNAHLRRFYIAPAR